MGEQFARSRDILCQGRGSAANSIVCYCLGITAVELLPVFQYDPQDAPPGLTNYWGYAPVSFFAPHAGYSAARDPCAVLDEFRDMVKALHRAGIEVIEHALAVDLLREVEVEL